MGLKTIDGITPIVPVIVGETATAIRMQQALFEELGSVTYELAGELDKKRKELEEAEEIAARFQAERARKNYELAKSGNDPESKALEAEVRDLKQGLAAAEERADFLGLYSGNRSALALLAELSQAIPTDLDVLEEAIQVSADLGVVISASHNPGGPDGDFGIKFNTPNGGPAAESVTEAIHQRTLDIDHYQICDSDDVDLGRLGKVRLLDTEIEVIDPTFERHPLEMLRERIIPGGYDLMAVSVMTSMLHEPCLAREIPGRARLR